MKLFRTFWVFYPDHFKNWFLIQKILLTTKIVRLNLDHYAILFTFMYTKIFKKYFHKTKHCLFTRNLDLVMNRCELGSCNVITLDIPFISEAFELNSTSGLRYISNGLNSIWPGRKPGILIPVSIISDSETAEIWHIWSFLRFSPVVSVTIDKIC